ncbi:S1 family peptidase [Haloechinothrix sp. LS1_15]|uniref:S1 family peptidase n=1 Tax=Haloechinothrix sp. LS1_15 TaxID=2652248 RepID=UPI00294B4E71|nr:S1 family peptidase [Haloechinothrix sp. LS1_15]
MTVKRVVGITGSTAVALGLLTTGSIPATATDSPATPAGMDAQAATAMSQDLGVEQQQLDERLARQDEAITSYESLSERLGEAYGGSYYDAERGTLVVGVADASRAEAVPADAIVRTVDHSMTELSSAVDTLNADEPHAPRGITSWGIDPETNSVTVTVLRGHAGAAESYLDQVGMDPAMFRIERTDQAPQRFNDVEGGESYQMNQGSCSIGFSVEGGFLTAGHCPEMGGPDLRKDGQRLGTATDWVFPGADWALASTTDAWNLTPRVSGIGTVSGGDEAPVGAEACKSGATTGVTCGTIQAKNQTVRYPEGAVHGLTQTSIIARPGDSGGSVMAGNQAQGMVSGGDDTTMFFEPVDRALGATGARLITG